MAEERVKRRLSAILAADVVGYSRLMEKDEAGTLAALIRGITIPDQIGRSVVPRERVTVVGNQERPTGESRLRTRGDVSLTIKARHVPAGKVRKIFWRGTVLAVSETGKGDLIACLNGVSRSWW